MKTKELNSIEWLELATGKDDFAPNLKGIYQDNDNLVSTDGHRLHIVKLENQGDKKGYLDPTMAGNEYPNYKMVIPEKFKLHSVLKVTEELKAFLNHVIAVNKVLFEKRERINEIVIDFYAKTISYDYQVGKFNLNGSYSLGDIPSVPFLASVKANYLLDAIKGSVGFNVSFSGYLDAIKLESADKVKTVILMPIRSDKVKEKQAELDKIDLSPANI